MHCLLGHYVSVIYTREKRGWKLTAFSDCCWKCTKNTVLIAKVDVASSVSFDARDIF